MLALIPVGSRDVRVQARDGPCSGPRLISDHRELDFNSENSGFSRPYRSAMPMLTFYVNRWMLAFCSVIHAV